MSGRPPELDVHHPANASTYIGTVFMQAIVIDSRSHG